MTRASFSSKRRRMVVALGGNAILRRGEDGTIEQQIAHADACMGHIARILREGHRIVLTHGNGPIVGNILVRNLAVRDRIPPMPLYICDADSEGGIGFLLQMTLYNRLRFFGVTRPIVTIITQVVVDRNDPAFANPTKPIGPFFQEPEARRLMETEGWAFLEEAGLGFRRVVSSPRPLRIIEAPVIRRLMEEGDVVIGAGGGGIPVVEGPDGSLKGVDAVIDKDWSSAILACQIEADLLVILMDEEKVFLDYGKPGQRGIDKVSASDMNRHLLEGHFPAGTMGPKVEASLHFLRTCGEEVIVCRAESLMDALNGRTGTRIIRDDIPF